MGLAHRLASAFVCFVCIVTLASTPTRAADSAICTGLVVDENGVPLVAAQIKLEDTLGNISRTETDGAGRFTLRMLRPRLHTGNPEAGFLHDFRSLAQSSSRRK